MKKGINYIFLLSFSFLSNCFGNFDSVAVNNLCDNENSEYGISEILSKFIEGRETQEDLALCYEVTTAFIAVLRRGVSVGDTSEKDLLNIDSYVMFPARGKVVDKFNNFIANAAVSNIAPFCNTVLGKSFFYINEMNNKDIGTFNKTEKINSVSDITNFDISQNGFFESGDFSFDFKKEVLNSVVNFALKKCIISNWFNIYNLSIKILSNRNDIEVKEKDVDNFIDESAPICKNYVENFYLCEKFNDEILSKFSGNVRDFIPRFADLAIIINKM